VQNRRKTVKDRRKMVQIGGKTVSIRCKTRDGFRAALARSGSGE
jgi:hypothetical protein